MYGDQTVRRRYRYNEKQRKRFKTVELIVEEVALEPKAKPITGEMIVGLRVGWPKVALQYRIKGRSLRATVCRGNG